MKEEEKEVGKVRRKLGKKEKDEGEGRRKIVLLIPVTTYP